MKCFSFLILVLFARMSFANTYYFSSTSGDDNRSVEAAQNPETPWRTIGKLNSLFSSLREGDVVLLKRGDTFYGSITASSAGNKNKPITISAYGWGDKPVVSGLTTMNDWVPVGNGIWESYNPSLGATVNTVLLNNVAQQMGRYPNSNTANKGYLTYDAFSSTSISDNELSSSVNWTGAEVVIRKLYWIMDRNVITYHSGNTLHFSSGSNYSPWQNKSGYFIQNDIKTLDQVGEWYYRSSSKKLYVYFGGGSPSNYNVEASSIDHLVKNAWSVGGISFDNITFKGSNSNTIQLAYSNDISITNCDIINAGGDAIKSVNSESFKLENSAIVNSNNNGVSLEHLNNNAILRNNRIENTHLVPGMGRSGDGNGFGIHISGNNNLVEHNEVINTGYSGVFFSGNSVVIKNNFINNYCLTKDDGAGIYTNTEPSESSYKGRKITENVIINGQGTPEGLADGVAHAHGIYLDGLTTGIEVSGNTVANNASYGIFSPNPNNIKLTNNIVYNNRVQFVMNNSIKNYSVHSNDINNNQFFSKLPTQMVSSLTTLHDNINEFGNFDNNYYARPFDDRMTIHNQYVNRAGTVSEVYDIETWRGKHKKDASSKRSPIQFPGYILNNLVGSNSVANGTFNNNVTGVGGWTGLNNMVISHNSGVLDGGSVQISFRAVGGSPGSSLVTINVGGLAANKKYILKFTLKGSNDNFSLGAYLRKNSGDYSAVTTTQFAKISSARTENTILFSVQENQADADIVFTVDNQNIQFWLDNIEFQEANVNLTNPDDYIRFEYNSTKSPKTVSLDKRYVDLNNKSYSGAVTLQPYSSVILLKAGENEKVVDNTPPTIIPKNVTIYADNNGQASIQPNDVNEFITDNSGVDQSSIKVSQTSFSCTTTEGGTSVHQAFTTTATVGDQNFGGELGLQFKVNHPGGIVVSQLGAFDHAGNGIYGSENGGIRVAIFNKDTRSIVPGLDVNIIGLADGFSNNHRMKNVAPVTLMPGDYVVVTKGYNKDELNGNGGTTGYSSGDVAGGAITLISGGLWGSSSNAFEYPTIVDGSTGHRYLAGTFGYSIQNSFSDVNHQSHSSTATLGNQSFDGELGMEFTVNDAKGIKVNQLGAFDHAGNGIYGSQNGGVRVAIFNKATQLIVPGLDAIVIGYADGLSGNHRMKNVAPVTLMPGDYVVVAKGYNKDELNGNTYGSTDFAGADLAGGAISLKGGGLFGSPGNDFNYPTTQDAGPGYRYFAGTFVYSTSNNGVANNNANSNGKNIHTVTITATDIHGNSSSATATVTVVCNDQSIVAQRSASPIQNSALAQETSSGQPEIGSALNTIKVFPNPTRGQFSVQLPGLAVNQVSIQILTESGKIVSQKSMDVNGTTAGLRAEFNLNSQAPGLYIIRVISTKGVQISKVLIVR